MKVKKQSIVLKYSEEKKYKTNKFNKEGDLVDVRIIIFLQMVEWKVYQLQIGKVLKQMQFNPPACTTCAATTTNTRRKESDDVLLF
jgi:hypothetical protein